MGKSAILSIRIISDASKAKRGFEETQSTADKFGSSLNKLSVAATAVAGGSVVMAKKLEEAGESSRQANDRIESITKSMGQFGEQYREVAERATTAADKLATKTGIDPNSIKQAQATLSTFSSIEKTANQTGGAFDRATAAAADLSAAGFGSIESASTMLGKALQDPVTGMNALKRVGVTLSDAQKDQVKGFMAVGDAANAQKVILDAVNQQVGGTAENSATSSQKMQVAWEEMEENLGTSMLPMFDALNGALSDFAGWASQNSGLVTALGTGLLIVSGAVTLVTGAYKAWTAATQAWNAVQTIADALMDANPIGLIVIAIAALIAVVVTISGKWQAMGRIAADVWNTIIGWIKNAIGWVQDALGWIGKLLGAQDEASARQDGLKVTRVVNYTPASGLLGAARTYRSVRVSAGTPSAATTGSSMVINFNGVVGDPDAVASQIRKVLTQHDRINGRVAL